MRWFFVTSVLFLFVACSSNSGDGAPSDETDEPNDETEVTLDAVDIVSFEAADNASTDEDADAFHGVDEDLEATSLDMDDIEIVNPDEDTVNTGPCTVLFGLPNEKTGLTAEQCQPQCNCEGKFFQPPIYTEEDIVKLLALVPVNPPAEVTENPYEHPEEHQPIPGAVCGLLLDESVPNGYRLETFASDTAAIAAGAFITHWDGCGVCSTLTNLVVYMQNPDLTDPVRQCGINNLGNKEGNITCLQELGFDLPCAQIWYYNTLNTQKECFSVCMAALNEPYHNPDGTLNDCLLCDEEKSGAVFKAVAGRTRRNTGLPSSMCRPCSEVQPIYHYYW